MPEPPAVPPDALLLITIGCARCPVVLEALARLIKEGRLGRLSVVNCAAHPEQARALRARALPWMRIGPFVLQGAHSYGELSDWASAAAGSPDYGRYFAYLLESRELERVVELVRGAPELLDPLVGLLAETATPMGVRIGVGAALEELQTSGLLAGAAPLLERLCLLAQARTRADACHFLGLSGDPGAIPVAESLLDDPDPEVREIAQETLALLRPDRLADG